MLSVNAVRGYLQTMIDVKINDVLSDSVRASVLSLRSLLVRLFSSGYIFVSGIALERYSFFFLFVVSAVIVAGVGLYLIRPKAD